MNIKLKFLPVSCVVGLVAVLVIAGFMELKPAPLIVQGEVDATQITVASKIPGRVRAIHVKKGETVSAGTLLYEIESPEIRAKLVQAESAARAALAMQKKSVQGARKQEKQASENMWNKAEAGANLADKTYRRVKRLNEDGIVPAQKLDEATAALNAARETAEAAKSVWEMAKIGAREEDKAAALALADQAAGAVQEVEAYLAELRLVAPRAGQITNIIVEQGELAASGYPVVSLVDLNDLWVTFNMREDLLPRVKMGGTLTAVFPAIGKEPIDLTVNYIAPLGAFANWNATRATGDFDLKTFEVRAVPVAHVEGMRPGMSAVITWEK